MPPREDEGRRGRGCVGVFDRDGEEKTLRLWESIPIAYSYKVYPLISTDKSLRQTELFKIGLQASFSTSCQFCPRSFFFFFFFFFLFSHSLARMNVPSSAFQSRKTEWFMPTRCRTLECQVLDSAKIIDFTTWLWKVSLCTWKHYIRAKKNTFFLTKSTTFSVN